MNLLHQVLPRGVCKGLLWLPMTYICIAFLNHAIEVGSCKSQPKRTANAFCHFKGLWRVSLIAKDGWSLALLYAPNFLPFSLVPTPPAIPLSQPWHFCVRLHARSVFYRVHILRCLGPAQAQPVYKSSRWSHDVVWIGSVWSALLPAPEGTGSVFPHYQHRAGWIWNRLAVKMKVLKALVHRRSLRNLLRETFRRWVQGVLKGGHLCDMGIVLLYEQLCSRGSRASVCTGNTSLFGSWTDSYFLRWELDVIGNNSFLLPAFLPCQGEEFSFNWEIKRSLERFNEIKVLSPSHQFYSVSQPSSLYSSPENPKLINLALGILKCLLRKQLCFDRQQL